MRPSKRKSDQLRNISIETNFLNHAEGSCMIKFGNTHVVCSASVSENVPFFMKNQRKGWITAEYGMIPRSTDQRMRRESTTGKQTGRTQEIQRLIGRSLRAIMDLEKLGERQILIDCDVINADGGTRTAAITGSYVALYLAIQHLIDKKLISENPLKAQVSAISCGIRNKESILDLDYIEDSSADVDANFVISSNGKLIEVQGTAEEEPFSEEQLFEMLKLAKKGTSELFAIQNQAILNHKL